MRSTAQSPSLQASSYSSRDRRDDPSLVKYPRQVEIAEDEELIDGLFNEEKDEGRKQQSASRLTVPRRSEKGTQELFL